MKAQPPQILTKREAAAYLRISTRTLDEWRDQAAISCVCRPGYVRFKLSDLEDFLDRHHNNEGQQQAASKVKAKGVHHE